MERVDYVDTFIAVADDCRAGEPRIPPGEDSVAAREFRMVSMNPYRYTSGDVIFLVYADRHSIPPRRRPAARRRFYSKGQPCLRSSPLGKHYGWGIHADSEGRLALVGVGTPEYIDFTSGRRRDTSGSPIVVVKAMRNSRAHR